MLDHDYKRNSDRGFYYGFEKKTLNTSLRHMKTGGIKIHRQASRHQEFTGTRYCFQVRSTNTTIWSSKLSGDYTNERGRVKTRSSWNSTRKTVATMTSQATVRRITAAWGRTSNGCATCLNGSPRQAKNCSQCCSHKYVLRLSTVRHCYLDRRPRRFSGAAMAAEKVMLT